VITVIVKDHKGKDRQVDIICGFKNQAGTICALINNDRGEEIRVRIDADGISECGHPMRYGRQCYHVQAVLTIASLFGPEGIYNPIEVEADRMANLYPETAELNYHHLSDAYKDATKQVRKEKEDARGNLNGQQGFSFYR
jgi:hypothetical protein